MFHQKSTHNEKADHKLESIYPAAVTRSICFSDGDKLPGQQKRDFSIGTESAQATSLFYKGVTLVKTVCSIAKEKLW